MIYAGIPEEERRRRGVEALERAGLARRIRNKPNELSGGQQQRVAVARAMINSPALLLADEPTGALDSSTTAEVLKIFDELNTEGVTILLVTHEHDVGERAHRVVQFRDGHVIDGEGVTAQPGATTSPGNGNGDRGLSRV